MNLSLPKSLRSPAARSRFGWVALRVTLAVLLGIHGWARWLAGGVEPFGQWLNSQGLPFGFGIAVGITALEILGTPLLALGRWVTPLALCFAAQLVVGIVMVHAPAGWFVVGLGRNGVEYSVLLVVGLLVVALQPAEPVS